VWLAGIGLASLARAAAPAPAAPEPALPIVRAGAETISYPYTYVDTDGQLKGFAVDLLRAIEAHVGLKFEIVPAPPRELSSAIETGRLDLHLLYSDILTNRLKLDSTVPYLQLSVAIVVRKGQREIHALADLKGKKVLVGHDTVGETILIRSGLRDSIEYCLSTQDGLERLDRGEADAALAARLTANSVALSRNLRHIETLKAPVPGYTIRFCFGVRPGNKELLAQMNEGLAILQRKVRDEASEYDLIYDRWFGRVDSRGYSRTEIAVVIAIGLGLALLIATWAILRQRSLNAQIIAQAAALRASELKYRGVFESAADGLLVVRPADTPEADLLIEQINPAARRILWLDERPPAAASLRQLVPHAADLVSRIARATGQPLVFETEIRHDGQRRWVRVAVTHVLPSVLIALTDLTVTKEAEELLREREQQLRQGQKLEAIGTLASGIAHDFNNILTGIIGNVQLAAMDLNHGHTASPLLGEALRASERAKNLVKQILMFARKAAVKRETVVSSPIVDDALRFLRATTPASIDVQHRVGANLPKIEVDPTQLQQVIMNLCTNAVHAMQGRSGLIEVVEEALEVDAAMVASDPQLKAGSFVCISVRDTGCGMPAEILPHIFDPFYTTKPPGDGTGLGLSVVHGIIQSHGGIITVYSEPGSGSIFRVYLPVAQSEGTSPQTPPTIAVQPGRAQKILFVDDEKIIADCMTRILSKLGYTPTVHTRPLEAMACFAREPRAFDLVMTDLSMPELSGLEVARRVRALNAHIPIILASGYRDEKTQTSAAELAGLHFVQKPLDFTSLAATLAHLLKQEKQS
jgi:signal transduction histidine kinase/ActR/RegA family two-component response regulator